MGPSARDLARLLKSEKEKIRAVYKKDYAAAGDRVRMKLFLFWPGMYYYIVKLYDSVIIPLRQ